LHVTLAGLLPQQHVTFVDVSRNGQVVLVHIASDRDPGSWYVLKRSTNKLEKVLASRDGIDPALMAERRPVRIKASDGVELEAMLTIPRNGDGRRLPVAVLPHGGPHGASDDWFYDTDAQFPANRGYLVVQPATAAAVGAGVRSSAWATCDGARASSRTCWDGLDHAVAAGLADLGGFGACGASFGAYWR
jgi:dipeptidyl aminopeptidase/acylaminoacyl peptidase